ncbi:MAG: alanine racemase [Chloroflexi bacterium]|nr:alanine racemase [Chloroflexota bacterium]
MGCMLNEPTISSNGVVRPTAVTVNLSRITANYLGVKTAVAPAKVMAVLKANAYGHGLVPVARHMAALGAPYLGVAFLEEALLLREAEYRDAHPGDGRHLGQPDSPLFAAQADPDRFFCG